MQVKNGDTVSVHYKGTFSDGQEFDNSRRRDKALEFEVGSGAMIQGFNKAVFGMRPGETKSVKLDPKDAYGERNPEALQSVPRTAFAPDFKFKVGGPIRGNGPFGPFMAVIQDFNDTEVTLDMNHPLAGKELNFEIELVSINDREESDEWDEKMKKAELLEVARSRGLGVNTRSTKSQIIHALQA